MSTAKPTIQNYKSLEEAAKALYPDQLKTVAQPSNALKVVAYVAGIIAALAGLYFILSGTGHLPQVFNAVTDKVVGSILFVGGIVTIAIAIRSLNKAAQDYEQRVWTATFGQKGKEKEIKQEIRQKMDENNVSEIRFPYGSNCEMVISKPKQDADSVTFMGEPGS